MLDERERGYAMLCRRVSQHARQGSCHCHPGRIDPGQAQSGPCALRLLGFCARLAAHSPMQGDRQVRLCADAPGACPHEERAS
jgi:hypothetical protein